MQTREGVVLALLLVIAYWLISLIWGLAGKAQIAITQSNEAKKELQSMEERKRSLEANLSSLDTDLGKDAAIRTAFGVARPGEEVIVVVPPKEATTTPEKTWWQKVMGWF
jgi:cell division protein FtsB